VARGATRASDASMRCDRDCGSRWYDNQHESDASPDLYEHVLHHGQGWCTALAGAFIQLMCLHREQGQEGRGLLVRPQPISGSSSLDTSWFSAQLRCGRIHRLHWSITVVFVMGPPSRPALRNAHHTNRGALILRPTAGNRVRTTLNSRGIRSPRPAL
jgi:hypothetical protein